MGFEDDIQDGLFDFPMPATCARAAGVHHFTMENWIYGWFQPEIPDWNNWQNSLDFQGIGPKGRGAPQIMPNNPPHEIRNPGLIPVISITLHNINYAK